MFADRLLTEKSFTAINQEVEYTLVLLCATRFTKIKNKIR